MTTDPDRFLGREVFTYTQEKERFQKDLFQFHAGRGTHFLGLPNVSGRPVDLYLLYSLVTKNGGFHKVCDRNLWWKISPEFFHFPDSCVNSELALKQMYMRYLYLYERVNIHGDDPDHPDDEDAASRGSKPGRILVHQVPTRYNYRQHHVRLHDRAHYGLSTNLATPNEYERLEKSLLSGLPNEVDFAINVCCILSMEGSSAIKFLSHRNLLELLLAHVGLFLDGSSLQHLYHSEWLPKTGRNFTQFWYESLEHNDLDYSSTLLDMISCTSHRLHDQKLYMKQRSLAGSELLHLTRDRDDPVVYRVKQISQIIRNLSFDTPNSKAMAESSLVFNFAMLCCHNTLPELKSAGMDILENISKMHVIPAIHESSTQLIIRCLHKWMYSQDKLELVSALHILSGLTRVEQNEDTLVDSLSPELYEQIVSLARVYDLQLIVAALDALYFLSEIGEGPCESIALVKHCIDFLTNLVTVETQSFGESALGGIIVRDHRIAPLAPPAGGQPRPVGTMMGPPAAPFNSRPTSRPPSAPPQPVYNRPQTPPSAASSRHSQPARPMMSSKSLTPAHKAILPATPQTLATMSPEQVACNWLRANYEPYPEVTVFTAKVHQEYVLWLQRRGGPCAVSVSPNTFVSCVKKVFPYSELVVSGPESQLSGLRWKANHSTSSSQTSAQQKPSLSQPPPAYGAPHILSPGTKMTGMPPRISSPSHTTSNDMLRSMLLNDTSRPRSDSAASSNPSSSGRNTRASLGSSRGRSSVNASPRARSSDSPLPPVSPASSMELQVCGNAEKAESLVNGASISRIERVENNLSGSSHQPSESTTDSKCNGDLSPEVQDELPVKKKKEEGDSSVDTSDSGVPPSVDSKSNGVKENGLTTPCSPLCNGHVTDTESVGSEAERQSSDKGKSVKLNGSGDSGSIHPPLKNGFINGLEKMIADIADEKPGTTSTKQTGHRRHHSGDSLASQSSTSTQLSTSQQSASSEQKADEQTSTQESTAGRPTATPAVEASTNQETANNAAANQIPTVVESVSNRFAEPVPPRRASLSKTTGNIHVNIPDNSVTSPLTSPGASSRGKSRKRRRSTASTDSRQSTDSTFGQYKCLWEGCGMGFTTCSLLRKHVSQSHTLTAAACVWAGCDRVERKRWALVSHVCERHTSDAALAKALANREKGIVPVTTSGPPQSPSIYTPQAAKIAILRNYPKPPFPEFMDVREGPVTKHIRFTAALILRNICRYSSTGRTLLKKHESNLAVIAGSSMEASAPVLNCLWEMQHSPHAL